MMKDSTPSSQPRVDRGDATREKLLNASIDVFGRYGFDGATTRMLADKARVNLQAIPYYFGGKEGLYIAAAEHLASIIGGHVADLRSAILTRFAELDADGKEMAPAEARAFLTQMVQRMIVLFVSEQSESWARFIIREQMEPTEAFTRIYGSIMRPMIEMARRLIGVILADDPASERIRLRTLSFVGSVLIFRMAHAAVYAQLEWETAGPDELEILRQHAADLVAALGAERDYTS
ncbi:MULTISPECIES: CerR family C-terminal domain-containing protein [unclassified Sinorhizobium]|uniref:CerR family C-terminal domain-containing protein n=1 Tax=unclassified Sinorhizobium TaxID=2613772 RepID=UPI0024C3176D|nr:MULTISPECIES: CerR family C-terminal domain-containing protein [unclassified Sinorhizobium]MDK1373823.1 CerR family C-terminal domain-containing protein [Sinorhizobium sp. 6-70]MDK1482579.1 CerR family C-terminal domain-containing protein [Sinorhizobium sp. 6-117]